MRANYVPDILPRAKGSEQERQNFYLSKFVLLGCLKDLNFEQIFTCIAHVCLFLIQFKALSKIILCFPVLASIYFGNCIYLYVSLIKLILIEGL